MAEELEKAGNRLVRCLTKQTSPGGQRWLLTLCQRILGYGSIG